MKEPLISVLMTAFNREKYIAEAIESVLSSTYKNFELIIADDGSKDTTVEIAKSYAEKDDRIAVYINEKNLGDYPNRNRAASYAKGKYLKYVDADDMIYPWGLKILVDTMEKFPNAGWGLCSIHQDKQKVFPFELLPMEAYLYHYEGPGLFHKAPLSSIIKKSVFDEIGGFSGKQHLGDFELWHLLALYFPVVLMPIGLVWYREHADQQNAQNKSDPRVPFKYTVAALHFFQKEKSIPLSQSQKEKIIAYHNSIINKIIVKEMLKGHFKLLRDLIKISRSTTFDFKSLKWND